MDSHATRTKTDPAQPKARRLGAAARAVLAIAGIATLAISGCGVRQGLTIENAQSGDRFESSLPLSVYRFRDKNTADVYLTDLPREALDPEADIFGVSGQLVHIHLFVTPEAGETPIDDTACSISIRHVIIAQGQVGVYAGGGFMQPRRRPGEPTFSGKIRGATLRLVSSSKGFVDRLGPANFSGGVVAPVDDAMCSALAERLRTLIELTEPHVKAPLIKDPAKDPAKDAAAKDQAAPADQPAGK